MKGIPIPPSIVALPVSPTARLVAITLYLELAPSGINRVPAVEYQLAEMLTLPPPTITEALDELTGIDWLVREGAVLFIPTALGTSRLNVRNRNHAKAVLTHLDKITQRQPSALVDAMRDGIHDAMGDSIPDAIADASEIPSGIGNREEGKGEGGKGNGEKGKGNGEKGMPSAMAEQPRTNPVLHIPPGEAAPPSRRVAARDMDRLVAWLGSTASVRRAAELWDANTPGWPAMILDRYGPDGVSPKPQGLVLLALSDLTRKTRGALSPRSLEAFVDRVEAGRAERDARGGDQ